MFSQVGSKILKGTVWSGLQAVVNGTFTYLVNLLLARLLIPDEFGIVGMATVFVGLFQALNELGITAALVQRKAEKLNESHFYTAFWSGIIWSVIIYAVVWFIITPFAASFYQERVLLEIIPYLSLGLLINPLNMVHHALLTRQMDFRKLAFVSNVSKICAGLAALISALAGVGVWALVINTVAAYAIAVPLYYRATRWTPRLIWDLQAFKDIFGFGAYYTGTSVVNHLVTRLDYLLIGKLLSTSALGAYTFGFMFTDTLRSQLMAVMNKVMYPVYGKLQDDIALVRKYYLNVIKYNSLAIYPIMGLFIVLAEPLILEFFGDKWAEAIPVTRILSVAVLLHMLVNSNTSLIRGVGRPGLELKIQLFKAIFIYFPSVFIGTYFYGLIGAAVAVVVNKLLSVFIAQYFLKKLFAITWRDLWKAAHVPLVAVVLSVLFTHYLYEYLGLNYVLSALTLFIVYAAYCYGFLKSELKHFLISVKTSISKRDQES